MERTASAREVLTVALRLGVTSFGGPIAHLGYFRTEYVERRRWLSDASYAELVAVAQFLPGPSSSQVGMAVGWHRAGTRGALAAWVGFTLPSALAMGVFGALAAAGVVADQVWLQALKLVAVAVVLDAVLGMARRLAATPYTAAVAVATAVVLLLAPTSAVAQVGCLAAAGAFGAVLRRGGEAEADDAGTSTVRPRTGLVLVAVVAGLLVVLPLIARAGPLAELADAMYRAGALVFGGGHVVLPLLEAETVPELLGRDDFLAGYGLAQAMPGPLFTFGTYVGQVSAGFVGAVVATVAIFAPGLLLMVGVLPFWHRLRENRAVGSALVTVNAAVVGLLAAAWWDPIVTSAVASVVDGLFAAALFAALRLRVPPWGVVLIAVVASPLLLL